MKKVCIQVGHWNIGQLQQAHLRSWRSATVLQKSTGAAGERDWHWNEWMPRLRDKLIQAGIQVYIVDAIFQEETYKREYDLWISGHYDGGGTVERCMISAPSRETKPAYLNEEAQRKAEEFCAIWKEIYPQAVGVPNRDDFITIGMKDYYAFDFVGLDTPAVIIEHFNQTATRGQELKNDPEKVVDGDFRAIIKFLGISPPEEEQSTDAVSNGHQTSIETYRIQMEQLVGILKLPAGTKDWGEISGKAQVVFTKAVNYDNLIKSLAKILECAEASEDAVKEALEGLDKKIKEIKDRKLEEFKPAERIFSGLADLLKIVGKIKKGVKK